MNTTKISRRSLLASIPVAATMGMQNEHAVLALSPMGDDPIFGLISAHLQAMRDLSAAFRKQSDLEELHGEAGWQAGHDIVNAVGHEEALTAVLSTPPTTLQGVVALLDYAGGPMFPDEEGDHDYSVLEDAGLSNTEATRAAAAEFLPMVADALRGLGARKSQI